MQSLDPELRHRIEQVVGQPLTHVRGVQRGYTPAIRLVASLADGTTVFVKAATNDLTTAWLRKEHHVYESLSGSFLARYLGWDDEGSQPVLILEDLSHGFWPPPWTDSRIHQVVETLETVSRWHVPDLPLLEDDPALTSGWTGVAEEPEPFLSLGLATEEWLRIALPILLQVNGREVVRGKALLHIDVRSDNLCFINDRTVLIDWNWACVGNPAFDLGAWLPSLETEGGPPPETILPDAGGIAALISGFFAYRAGKPPLKDAPLVRQLQLAQLKSALPWAIRALGLPPLDGHLTWNISNCL